MQGAICESLVLKFPAVASCLERLLAGLVDLTTLLTSATLEFCVQSLLN